MYNAPPPSDSSTSAPAQTRFAMVMVVGPGEQAIAMDTLASARQHYPNADIWLMDDCTQDGTYPLLESWAKQHAGVFLYRNKTPNGFPKLPESFCRLFLAILGSGNAYDMVVKLDTDSYFTDAGLDTHFRALFAQYGPGKIGAYRVDPEGNPREFMLLGRMMQRDCLPLDWNRQQGYVRLGAAFYAPFMRQALRHGYTPGEHIQGGLYAIHIQTLQAMAHSGFFQAFPPNIRYRMTAEDILFSMVVRSVGHALIEMNQAPHPTITWIRHRSPLSVSVETLRQRQVAAIHPVKNDATGWQLREAFRQHPPVTQACGPVGSDSGNSPRELMGQTN